MALQTNRLYRRNIIICFVFMFLTRMHFIGGVLVPFYTSWGHIPFSQIMILQAIFSFAVVLFEVPTGAVADCFGRKKSLLFGAAIIGCATQVYSWFANFWIFAIGEVVWAFGLSLMSGADQALLYDSLKEMGKEHESKKYLNWWNSAAMIALGIAAPIGSHIGTAINLQSTMRLMAIPLFCAVAIGMLWHEPGQEQQHVKKKYVTILAKGISVLKNNRILRIITIEYVITTAPIFFIVWAYQLLLQRLELPLVTYGYVHAAMTVSQIAVFNSYAALERIVGGKRTYLVISGILVGLCFAVAALVGNQPLCIAAIMLIAGFGLSRTVVMQNYLNKHIDSEVRATVLSSISMLYRLIATASNLAFGALADTSVTYPLLIIGSIVFLMSLLSRIKEEWLIH